MEAGTRVGDPFAELFERPDGAGRPEGWPVHPASLGDELLLRGCERGSGRTGGPGGQNRNKVSTMVVLRHGATGLSAQAGERRSVRENLPVALRRLRLVLASAHRVGVPDGEARTALWRSRVRGGRIVLSERHRDYPSMLAEAMDMLFACGLDERRAATRLGVTVTQLVRLVASHAPALAALNAARESRGKHKLRG